MSTFHRQCFQTTILEDEELGDVLAALCVDPDKARYGDILAVEFPYATNDSSMETNGAPSRALVAQGKGSALRLPWYTLVEMGLGQERTQLMARAFGRMSSHWCLNLSEQMAAMAIPGFEGPEPFDLLLAPGCGALIRNFEDLDEGLDPDIHTTDALIQDYIDRHSAIAVAPYSSHHARVGAAPAAERGSVLAGIAATLCDPRTFKPISPAPRLP